MTLTNRCLTGLAGLMFAGSTLAAPMEVSGIKLADPVEVAGSKLQLNGAGIRFKAIFKVYVAALYLDRKATTAEEAFSTAGAKRISITLLREIDSNELGKSFTKAFEENVPKNEMSKLIPGLMRMGQVFADQKKIVANEGFTIDWIPGTGTVITVKGKTQGEPIKEAEFYNAMLRIWIGQNPADWKLKDALLGKSS